MPLRAACGVLALLATIAEAADYPGEPLADAAAMVTVGGARFTVLTADLVRLEWSPSRPPSFEDRQTMTVWNRRLAPPPFTHSTAAGVTTIATAGFTLHYTPGAGAGISAETLRVELHRTNLLGLTEWSPSTPSTGNLNGTWRTWDTLDGTQDMNCTRHSPWITTHEPEHCQFGLVSKAGWAAVDDSRAPVLTGGWVAPQLGGTCEALEKPCFEVQNHDVEGNCVAAGCCWRAANATANATRSDQHIGGYHLTPWPWPVYAFGAVEPETEPLKLFFNAAQGDHWTTFGEAQAANATASGFVLLRDLGHAPTAASTGATKKPVYLHYSERRKDHFTSASPHPPAGYTSQGIQGYLLDGKPPRKEIITLAWYWSSETASGAVSPTSGDNVLAEDDGANALTQCFARSGNVDVYLFTHGLDYEKALSDYTLIAGKIPIPRRHMLGVSWSRWGQAVVPGKKWHSMNQTETV